MAIDHFVLVLDLAPLVLKVQNGTPLRMIQRGGPIEETEDERGEHSACNCLQAESTKNDSNTIVNIKKHSKLIPLPPAKRFDGRFVKDGHKN